MDVNGIYGVYQSAYRPQHSAESALLRIHNDVAQSIDSRRSVLLVLLDLTVVRDLRDFWFKFFQKHQIWLICPLWYTVSIFAERQDERPLAGRHFEKNQDGRHFSPNMYDTTF